MLWLLLVGCVVPYYGAVPDTDTATADTVEDTPADTPDPGDTPEDTVDTPAVDTPEDTTPGGGGNFNITANDTCAGAVGGAVLSPGTYHGTFAGLSNSGVNPVCLRYGSLGADTFFKVTLGNAQTMNVRLDPAAGDGQIFLLMDCNNGATCIAGSDDFTGQAETLSFSNSTGQPQTAYLVLALYGENDPKGEYDLTLTVQ